MVIKYATAGSIFTLADSTFAFACNSLNKAAVAAGCSIEFLKAWPVGDDAHCLCGPRAEPSSGRHGIYDMKVTNQKGEVIAMFRGKSAQIRGTVIPNKFGIAWSTIHSALEPIEKASIDELRVRADSSV
jgi:phenylacetic acid degradation protein PaaD